MNALFSLIFGEWLLLVTISLFTCAQGLLFSIYYAQKVHHLAREEKNTFNLRDISSDINKEQVKIKHCANAP